MGRRTVHAQVTTARHVTGPVPAAWTVERLSVVVLNWRAADLTLRAARAVMADGVPAARIVVVDNGSTDDSVPRLRAALPEATVVALTDNGGISRAYNAGARALDGDTYLFLNNDAFLHRPGTAQIMIDALRDRRVGMVVPRVLNPDLTLQASVVPLNRPVAAFVRGSGMSHLVPDRLQPRLGERWRHDRSRRVWGADMAAALIRGQALDAVGGFDERIERYAEDQDICWRLARRGWHVWFEMGAEFVHLGGASEDPRTTVVAEQIGRSEGAVIREHLPAPAAAASLGFMRAGLAARIAAHRALGHPRKAAELAALNRGYGSGWRLPGR